MYTEDYTISFENGISKAIQIDIHESEYKVLPSPDKKIHIKAKISSQQEGPVKGYISSIKVDVKRILHMPLQLFTILFFRSKQKILPFDENVMNLIDGAFLTLAKILFFCSSTYEISVCNFPSITW